MLVRPSKIGVTAALMAMTLGVTSAMAQKKEEPKKLARPPKQWPAEVRDVFFEDARTKLVGSQPDFAGKGKVADAKGENVEPVAAADGGGTPSESSWSKLIDAEAIETEIKRLAQALATDVKSPSGFKGGGYKECRRHFSMLAALFAIAGQFDSEVRWKDSAPTLRDQFARAGHNCKVANDQTFQEATARRQELADLITGTRPKKADAEAVADWPQVADRPPLMQRLNIAQQDRLTKWLANETEFSKQGDEIRHEAQIVAALADIIARKGYEFADDEQFAQYARDLRDSANAISAGVDSNNYQQAKEGGVGVTKACANCHEGYRG